MRWPYSTFRLRKLELVCPFRPRRTRSPLMASLLCLRPFGKQVSIGWIRFLWSGEVWFLLHLRLQVLSRTLLWPSLSGCSPWTALMLGSLNSAGLSWRALSTNRALLAFQCPPLVLLRSGRLLATPDRMGRLWPTMCSCLGRSFGPWQRFFRLTCLR